MGEDTERKAVQSFTNKILVKALSTIGGLVLTGLVIGLWNMYVDIQALKIKEASDISALKDKTAKISKLEIEIQDLKLNSRSGPQWIRDKLTDYGARIRELERK